MSDRQNPPPLRTGALLFTKYALKFVLQMVKIRPSPNPCRKFIKAISYTFRTNARHTFGNENSIAPTTPTGLMEYLLSRVLVIKPRAN